MGGAKRERKSIMRAGGSRGKLVIEEENGGERIKGHLDEEKEKRGNGKEKREDSTAPNTEWAAIRGRKREGRKGMERKGKGRLKGSRDGGVTAGGRQPT